MAPMLTATPGSVKEPLFAVCTWEQAEGRKSLRWGADTGCCQARGNAELGRRTQGGKGKKREMKITGTTEAKGPNVAPLPVGREMSNQQSPVRSVQESPGTCLNKI